MDKQPFLRDKAELSTRQPLHGVSTCPLQILLVEDDEAHAELVRRGFDGSDRPVRLVVKHTLEDARSYLKRYSPDLVLVDMRLPDGSGAALLEDAVDKPYPFVVLTSSGDVNMAVSTIKAGAHDYVIKSLETLTNMSTVVRRILREWENKRAREQVESELAAEREHTAGLIRNCPAVICGLSPDGSVLYVNPACEQLTGYCSHELVGQNWWQTFFPGPRYQEIQQILHSWVSWEQQDVELVLTNRAGDQVVISWNSTCRYDETGLPVEIVGLAVNMTDRYRARQAVQHSAQWAEQMYDQSPVMMHSVDASGRFCNVNRKWLKVMGYEREEVIGQLETFMMSNESARHARSEVLPELWRNGSCEDVRYELLAKDGRELEVLMDCVVTEDFHGQLVSLAVVRDVTELNANCRELKKAKMQAQALNRRLEQAIAEAQSLATRAEVASEAKTAFLANMSHELRTPMTAIQGFVDLLLDGELTDAERTEYIHTVKRNSDQLMGIINDLLDVSRIERDEVAIDLQDCRLPVLLQEVYQALQVHCKEKGLAGRMQLLSPVPERIQIDPVRFREIMLNLVNNAVKFTDTGYVELAVGLSDEDQLLIEVRDTGIGLDEQKLDLLFEPFSQLDGTCTRQHGGVGVGLTISRQLARAMGGDIMACNRQEGGSCFTLKLPLGDVDVDQCWDDVQTLTDSGPALSRSTTTPEEEEDSVLMSARILLAEDGVDNRRLFGYQLRRMGLNVEMATHGRQAVEMGLHSMIVRQPYDAILMDIQMPELNGYQATRRLRQAGYAGPIIALTAHAMADERQRCLDAGCDEHIAKPTRQATLHEVLSRLILSHRRQQSATQSSQTH